MSAPPLGAGAPTSVLRSAAELSGFDAGDEGRERAGGEVEDRTAGGLGVTDRNNAVRNGEIGGDFDATDAACDRDSARN